MSWELIFLPILVEKSVLKCYNQCKRFDGWVENLNRKERNITLRCGCAGRCTMLVVDKTIWEDGEKSYNLSMHDSRYAPHAALFGRLKNASKILLGKPIYYNDIYIDDLEKINGFVNEFIELEKWDGE